MYCTIMNLFLTYIAPRLYKMLGICCVVLLCLLVFPFLEEDFQRKYIKVFTIIFIIIFLMILYVSGISTDTILDLNSFLDTSNC